MVAHLVAWHSQAKNKEALEKEKEKAKQENLKKVRVGSKSTPRVISVGTLSSTQLTLVVETTLFLAYAHAHMLIHTFAK